MRQFFIIYFVSLATFALYSDVYQINNNSLALNGNVYVFAPSVTEQFGSNILTHLTSEFNDIPYDYFVLFALTAETTTKEYNTSYSSNVFPDPEHPSIKIYAKRISENSETITNLDVTYSLSDLPLSYNLSIGFTNPNEEKKMPKGSFSTSDSVITINTIDDNNSKYNGDIFLTIFSPSWNENELRPVGYKPDGSKEEFWMSVKMMTRKDGEYIMSDNQFSVSGNILKTSIKPNNSYLLSVGRSVMGKPIGDVFFGSGCFLEH